MAKCKNCGHYSWGHNLMTGRCECIIKQKKGMDYFDDKNYCVCTEFKK